jgi:hypothetical protein
MLSAKIGLTHGNGSTLFLAAALHGSDNENAAEIRTVDVRCESWVKNLTLRYR